MKKQVQLFLINSYMLASLFAILSLNSCNKEVKYVPPIKEGDLPESLMRYLKAEGYSTNNVIVYQDGYIIEGDIFLSKAELSKPLTRSLLPPSVNNMTNKVLIAGAIAQYRSTNIVAAADPSVPRVISVSLDPNANQTYSDAFNTALTRYNNLSINLTFQRVTVGADISVVFGNLPDGVWGLSPLFPSADGKPGTQVIINKAYITTVAGNDPLQGFLSTLFAHEMGHCIGLRHTDYMDRNFSCNYGGSVPPEADPDNVGAVHIPGTPTTADAGSWMLACMGQTTDRPFNANDITALRTLYPRTFYNAQKSETFVRSNCGSGLGGSIVTYTVPAGKYTSVVSQADADQKAQNEINTTAQSYADANGSCSASNITHFNHSNNTSTTLSITFRNRYTNVINSYNSLPVPGSPGMLGPLPQGVYDITISPGAASQLGYSFVVHTGQFDYSARSNYVFLPSVTVYGSSLLVATN